MEGFLRGLDRKVVLVNCYGPYLNREVLWSHISQSVLLFEHSLILGGDLNFKTSINELWGASVQLDPFVVVIYLFLLDSNLVDICRVPLATTWRNG